MGSQTAPTNVDLHEAVDQDKFRRDFLDRLEALTLRLPSLRERAEDVPLLVEHFLAAANEEEGTDVGPLATADANRLARECGHTSIRVIRNAIRRLVVVKRKGPVGTEDFVEAGLIAGTAVNDCEVEVGARDHGTTQVEWAVTDAILRKHNGDVAGAIQELGVSKSA